MKTPPPIEQLLAAARRGRPKPAHEQAPFGFATRVVARSFAAVEDHLAPWERLARWGAAAATLLAVVAFLLGQRPVEPNPLATLAAESQEVEAW
jgi:hypothetical protein